MTYSKNPSLNPTSSPLTPAEPGPLQSPAVAPNPPTPDPIMFRDMPSKERLSRSLIETAWNLKIKSPDSLINIDRIKKMVDVATSLDKSICDNIKHNEAELKKAAARATDMSPAERTNILSEICQLADYISPEDIETGCDLDQIEATLAAREAEPSDD